MTANSNNSFTGWMTDHSAKNKGRVSRDAYMAEASRRWDTMDTTKQGLTTAEIGRMYGYPSTLGGPTPATVNEKKGITR